MLVSSLIIASAGLTASLWVAFAVAILVIVIISKGLIVVRQAEVVIIERLGKYYKTLNSGLHLVIPVFDHPTTIHWRYNKIDYQGNTITIQRVENRISLRETVYDFRAKT